MVQKTRKVRKHPIAVAVAVFQGPHVEGEVILQQVGPNSVHIQALFTRLPPGKHGFHIHKAGDLRGKGCQGACAHYHAGPPCDHGAEPNADKRPRHTGDLGNIEMPKKGDLKKEWIIKGTTVRDLWGRSLIVHADEDDLGLGEHDDSKTTGHSGARIACAILGRGSCTL
jgi:superoxide dismutase, Cu-Zn family